MSPINLLKRPYRLYFRALNWRWFSVRIRSRGCCLLHAANTFEKPIFVSGCQRSGTTLVTSLISASPDIANSHRGRDEELAGAYVLCGETNPGRPGRYCFQTTYLNECYLEYLSIDGHFNLIWVLRNPESVIYSMVYNWARFPLNELFLGCGKPFMTEEDANAFRRNGLLALSPIKRASYAFIGKAQQFLFLSERLPTQMITPIEYESLVSSPAETVTALCRHLRLSDRDIGSAASINKENLGKAINLCKPNRETIRRLCAPVYSECLERSRSWSI